ncbi:MAG: ferritin-like domain-containing protein [Candidatus Bathyanammoxibius sp.]
MAITVDDVIKLAIEKEEAAYKLYSGILDKIADPGAREMVSELAKEERLHVEILQKLDAEKIRGHKPKKIEDLKIAEYLEDRDITDTSNLQDVLVFAMKREKEAHEFYDRFAREMSDPDVKKVLEALAEQELKHKRKIEAFYDDVIYQED